MPPKAQATQRPELSAALVQFNAAVANLEKARPSEYKREGARVFGTDALDPRDVERVSK